MADIALHGPELLKLVALAKKRDLNFAYCPGNDPAEDVFVLDRKKNPEILGRSARGEGSGTKICFGTAKVKGKVMLLTCERELPQTAKKLKKFLKFESIAMNIVVMDIEGNILEEDVEDLGEDPDEADDADDGADEQLNQLKSRAAKLQVAVKNVPTEARPPLTNAFKDAVGAMQGGNLDKADATFSKIEEAITKLADAVANKQSAAPDPALGKLTDVAAGLSKRIDTLGGLDGADRLRAAHGVLEGQIAAGDAKTAAGTAKALGDAVSRVSNQDKVTPIERARADWIKTRSDMRDEITKLQVEIVTVCQGDDFPNIANESKALISYLDAFDSRLERALEALAQETDAARRGKLSEAARSLIGTYQSELDTPFFQAVDAKNGFKPVNVRAAAITSLNKVQEALSAAA
ncbi:MAG: hypothetical protein ABJP79_02830 [Tateyamaria sp.]|uniref:hypothetical protein n=1 Tax=Tateyamaria sp. TaxID=1929288 RepID=UPI00329B27F8